MNDNILKSNQERMDQAKQMFQESNSLNDDIVLSEKDNKTIQRRSLIIKILCCIMIIITIYAIITYITSGNSPAYGAALGFVFAPAIIYLLLACLILSLLNKSTKKKKDK